jgi:tight adherence protein B
VVLATVAFKFLFGFSLALSLLAGLAIGVMGPHMTLGMMISRRLTRFNQLFPEAIDLMVRGLKSGLPISETINNVGAEMSEPVGSEFRAISDAVRFGSVLDDALWEAARRIGLPEFKFFAISLSVQRETGGNLGETLGNLSDILRKRLTMRLKVKAMSSEARASAYIIGSLPFIMFLILYFMNHDYVMRLFTDPRGLIMTGVGLFVMLIGVAVMFKMVRFEV